MIRICLLLAILIRMPIATSRHNEQTSAIIQSTYKLTSCEVASDLSDAINLSVGRWHLVKIKSGWTGKISDAPESIEIAITRQGKLSVRDVNNGPWSYQLILIKNPHSSEIRYIITEALDLNSKLQPPPLRGLSFYFSEDGYFIVCKNQLIMGNTDVDGPDLIFEPV